MFKSAAIAVLLAALAACGAPRPRTAPQIPIQPSASLESLPLPGTYPIDAGGSELRVLVYRAGPLAGLGHNHVMINHALSGSVEIAASLRASSFSLSVPVSGFVVDDAQARRDEGADFPGEIPEEAKVGTLRNMLGTAVLNAAEFPIMSVKSVSIGLTEGGPKALVTISVAGHESTVSAPFTLQGDSHRLWAGGTFALRQTAVGLTPYSLFGGALQVQDEMTIKFKIAALIEGAR